MSNRQRKAASARGQRGEIFAAWFLRLKGYRIIRRGYRNPMGEIDIIARRGRALVFIEVKARDSIEGALNAVSSQQQQRIIRAATSFVGTHPEMENLDLRFDVIAVVPGRWPKHVTDAWRPAP